MMTESEATREARLRRAARRQGLVLRKSRRRDPRALDFGSWLVLDARTGLIMFPGQYGGSLDDIERFLRGE